MTFTNNKSSRKQGVECIASCVLPKTQIKNKHEKNCGAGEKRGGVALASPPGAMSPIRFLTASFPLFLFWSGSVPHRKVWQEMKWMSRKIINCPHCGKILSEDLWKDKPSSRRETVKCPQCDCQLVWKDGIRNTPLGKLQRYKCRKCAYRFSKW